MEYLQTKRLLKTNTRLFMLNRLPLNFTIFTLMLIQFEGKKNKDILKQRITNKNICVYLQCVERHSRTTLHYTTH